MMRLCSFSLNRLIATPAYCPVAPEIVRFILKAASIFINIIINCGLSVRFENAATKLDVRFSLMVIYLLDTNIFSIFRPFHIDWTVLTVQAATYATPRREITRKWTPEKQPSNSSLSMRLVFIIRMGLGFIYDNCQSP